MLLADMTKAASAGRCDLARSIAWQIADLGYFVEGDGLALTLRRAVA
jgi:hypothetical protein